MIEIRNASKSFRLGRSTVQALRDVTLTVPAGEMLAVTGPSGSGKSTLLNLIGCVERPSSGSVLFAGIDTSSLNPDEQADLRARKVGFIFQSFNLFPVLTAYENVEFPLLLTGQPAERRRARVLELLQAVGLESFSAQRPAELSGGQRQRVAIARALAVSPAVVLADEPTANLDEESAMSVIRLLQELNRSARATFIISTHDPKMMDAAARRVTLAHGKII